MIFALHVMDSYVMITQWNIILIKNDGWLKRMGSRTRQSKRKTLAPKFVPEIITYVVLSAK